MAKIADEVQALEAELAKAKEDKKLWEALIPGIEQRERALRAEVRQLQAKVDEHERNPLIQQVAALKAELSEHKASKQVVKLKERLRKAEEIIAREQSLRMQAENLPEVIRENMDVKLELSGIKQLMAKAGVTLKDMREAVIAQSKLDLAAKREQRT